jgi:hypothetical protein
VTLHQYCELEFVFDLLPSPLLLRIASSPPGGGDESVPWLPEPDRPPGVIDSIPLSVYLHMTSGDIPLEWQRRGYILLNLTSHYLQQTRPRGATVPNRPVNG